MPSNDYQTLLAIFYKDEIELPPLADEEVLIYE